MKRHDLLALFIISAIAVFLGSKLADSLDKDNTHVKVSTLADLDVFIKKAEVRNPADRDIYILARQWDWGEDIELQAGKSYVLHIASQDVAHAFHLPRNVAQTPVDLVILPGQKYQVLLENPKEGVYAIGCTLYCGIEHNKMRGRLIVRK